MAPSFAGDGISLHPGLHPDHDPNDLAHLVPSLSNELHWSQEGHRRKCLILYVYRVNGLLAALHGAKHAHMNTTFKYPTVVLEHSNQIESISCQDGAITACFKTKQAVQTVLQSWIRKDIDTFNLVTYHVGCGDESGARRSFFEATRPVIDLGSSCMTVQTRRVQEQEAIEDGELSWGTYVSPQ